MLVGQKNDPDCEVNTEMYLPVHAADLRSIVLGTRKLDRCCIQCIIVFNAFRRLGAEVYTEQFRGLTDKNVPRLTYATFMEASAGKSGFLQFKYWMMILYMMALVPLMLVAFMTDHCSVGISGGIILCTPSVEMLKFGCSYLGLPVDDWRYTRWAT